MTKQFMKNSVASLFATATLGLWVTQASAVDFAVGDGWGLTVRGFVNARADRDQRDLGDSEPLFPAPNSSVQADHSAYRMTPNMTQLGFGLKAPKTEGIANSGYVEFDFLDESASAPNRSNTASPRLRHAYWEASWGEGHSLLIGQTNVLFGERLPDLMFDNLSLALGSLFGRESQIRYTYNMPIVAGSNMVFSASINAPNSGLFNQGTQTAERSGKPFVHGKIAYQTEALGKAAYFEFERGGDVPAEIALTGFLGRERVTRQIGSGEKSIGASGVALSGVLPIIGIRDGKRAGALSITAQAWYVSNGDSYFGGNGQGIYETSAGKIAAIEGKGFFVTGKYFFTEQLSLTTQYSYEKNDLNDLVKAGTSFRIASGIFTGNAFGAPGVRHAQTVNATLWFKPFRQVSAGLGYDYRDVDYNNGQTGRNNRVSGTLFYNF